MRLATHPALSSTLQRDPVAFAAWYASVHGALQWPKDVVAIQKEERDKRLSLDRMMKLLSQINYALAGRTNAQHAKFVLEGYAVHAWVGREPRQFVEVATAAYEQFAALGAPVEAFDAVSPFAARLAELGRTLRLSSLEQDILAFAFLVTVSDELSGIFEQLATDRWVSGVLWTAIFNTSKEELSKAMRPNSPLRLSGILQAESRRAQFATVSPFWVELLIKADSLNDALLEPFDFKTGSGRPAKLLDEDLKLAIEVLKNAKEPGVNLLLYGAPSLDKRHLLRTIIEGAELTPWRVRRFDDAPRTVLPSIAYVAMRLLADKPCPVLVVERPAEVLHTTPSEFLRALFGIELSNEDILPFDENLLTTNPVPAVWLASDVSSLPEDTVARFVFHAPLKKADRTEQERALRTQLAELNLAEEAVTAILKLDGVSSAQLQSAVRVANLVRATAPEEREQAIVQAVRRSQRALARNLTERSKPSVTKYSLEYLNTAGRFTPEQILKSFRKRPKGSMLLYGPPGTGKTQFAEYLASELGLPLVCKAASALLSKWVGESEKNIAAAFEEAAVEDAILMFDEGDSFLRSRELAHNSWEVTQTNELLQRMERFEGIVIVATNLFRNLDQAALRRFTFKIEFRELDAVQRWNMFVTEADVDVSKLDPQTKEEWEQRLLLMKNLTPGDFATVKRQCLILDTQLSPEEWLEQLELECEIKAAAPHTGLGHRTA